MKPIRISAGPKGKTPLLAFLSCAFFISLWSGECAAQSKQPPTKPHAIPQLATIKDYPATGLMTGCGNLYFYLASHSGSSGADYVFLAAGDGSNAWMNLGGRDVRLKQIRSSTRDRRSFRRFHYRYGELRISVVIENFKPENAPPNESDSMFKMKITLRRGQAGRIVRAVGDSDC